MARSATRRTQRAHLRAASKRRRRGGTNRAPVAVQRTARRVEDRARAVRNAGERALSGDRPLILALVGVLALAVVVLSGPLQSYLDTHERVEVLEAQLAALEDVNADLGDRVEDLSDPDTIELLAREQQGFIRPGEVPYAVVPPDIDRPRIRDPRAPAVSSGAWYERAWEALLDAFGV